MKSILCFTSSLSGGGAQHQMSILSNLLSERGYDVTVVTYNDYPDRYKVNDGVRRLRIPAKGNMIKKLFIIASYLYYEKCDCIISYRSPVNFILLLALILKPNKKVIVGERNLTTKPSLWEKINYKFLYYTAKSIVANSYSQERYLKSLNYKWKKNVTTITNYTDLDKYIPSPLPTDNIIRLGVFSRFSPQKNCLRFAEALKLLKAREHNKFQVDWYGDKDKDETEYNRISEFINKNSLEDVLKLCPPTDDVQEMIKDYHVLCLPSLYEGFSNSISEGICAGRPMLVSDVSDNGVMVEDGVNGYLFNPHDVENMADAIEKMLKLSPEEREEMGRRSRKKAEELFDKEKFIGKYIDIIEKITK